MSSYNFSERHNAQSILWAVGGAMVGAYRLLSAVVGQGRRVASHFGPLCTWLWGLWALVAPDAALMVNVFLWAAVAAGAACVVVWALLLILSNPLIVIGAGIIAAYAYATCPRAKVVAK